MADQDTLVATHNCLYGWELGLTSVTEAVKAHDNCPISESPLSKEFGNTELAQSIRSLGERSFVHSLALCGSAHTLLNPAQVCLLGSATLLRAALESGAICCWLFEVNISVKERVARHLSRRAYTLLQLQKLGAGDESTRQSEWNKLDEFATQWGISPVKDRGNRVSYGEHYPTATDLSKYISLDGYRFLSGVTHGNHLITEQLAYKVTERINGGRFAAPNANLEAIAFLAAYGLWTLTHSAEALWAYLGYPSDELKTVRAELEKVIQYLKHSRPTGP